MLHWFPESGSNLKCLYYWNVYQYPLFGSHFSGTDVRLHQLDLIDLHLVQTFKYRQKQDSNKLIILFNFLKLIFLQLIFFNTIAPTKTLLKTPTSEDPKAISETIIGS